MAHIHTGDGQHDNTVSAYIVRLDTPEPSLMLHMHKKLGMYFQFGGHVELHENPWQALTHELLEESGYAMDQLRVLQPPARLKTLTGTTLHPQPISYQTHKFPGIDHSHTDAAFAFTTNEVPRHAISDGESAITKLVTKDELAAMPSTEILDNVRETGLFVFNSCMMQWEAVKATE